MADSVIFPFVNGSFRREWVGYMFWLCKNTEDYHLGQIEFSLA